MEVLVTAMSRNPSLSISSTITAFGAFAAREVLGEAKDTIPLVKVFLKIDKLLLPKFVVIISFMPSLSISRIFNAQGCKPPIFDIDDVE